MNIHDRSRLIPATAEPAPRYEAAAREHHPERNAAIERMWAIATAPILGSSLVFPRRFDRAVDKLLHGSGGDAVVPEHAIRYFGQVLHLDIDPFRLEARIADYISVDGGARWMGTSFLDAADWSEVITPIGKSPIHREMHALVAAGNDFRDSRAYKALVNAIALGKPSKRNGIRLSTVEEVEAYLRYCRDLIKSMRKRGVVRHREVGGFHRPAREASRRRARRCSIPPSATSASRSTRRAADPSPRRQAPHGNRAGARVEEHPGRSPARPCPLARG